jgi:hypothetical protein
MTLLKICAVAVRKCTASEDIGTKVPYILFTFLCKLTHMKPEIFNIMGIHDNI